MFSLLAALLRYDMNMDNVVHMLYSIHSQDTDQCILLQLNLKTTF